MRALPYHLSCVTDSAPERQGITLGFIFLPVKCCDLAPEHGGKNLHFAGSSLSHRAATLVLKRLKQSQVYLGLGSTILLVIFVSVGWRILLSHFPNFQRLYLLLVIACRAS